MPRTQVKGQQIHDDTLTGADITDGIGIYDETDNYSIGNRVFWGTGIYECILSVTGGTSGDLSNTPNIATSNWKFIVLVERIVIPMFGRDGSGSKSVWLKSIGGVDAWPKSSFSLGVYLPNISNGFILERVTVKNDQAVTGDLEIHVNGTVLSPIYATTGIAKITLSAALFGETSGLNVSITGNSRLQCYFRHTSGKYDNMLVTLTYYPK